MKVVTSSIHEFPKHFDGKRFYNPDALQAPGYLDALRRKLAIGVVTALASACTSTVEWGADHVPEKRMGVFGLVLILFGFVPQSTQYWVVLLEVSIPTYRFACIIVKT